MQPIINEQKIPPNKEVKKTPTKRKRKRNNITKSKNEPINNNEMALLMQPLENKKGFKNYMKHLWESSHYPIRKINWITFFFIIAISTFITISATNLISKHVSKDKEAFGLLAKLESLKQSHDYYTSMATKDEMLYSWIKSFSKWRYKVGGDPRNGNGDCVGAVYDFLRMWNSNVYFENIQWIITRCESLISRGELKKRLKYDEVKTGDIIIIQLKPNSPEHVGIVYDTTNGFVRYMDVNAGVQTWGLEKFKFGTMNIYAIYEVSYSLWIGSLMKEINEIK